MASLMAYKKPEVKDKRRYIKVTKESIQVGCIPIAGPPYGCGGGVSPDRDPLPNRDLPPDRDNLPDKDPPSPESPKGTGIRDTK